MRNYKKVSRAFTLVELLVVIAIIAILAGLLIPALGRAKTVTKIKMAKVEMASMTAAIQQYKTEYSRLPSSKAATASLNNANPDFTFGNVLPDGSLLATNNPAIKNPQNNGYQNANSELMTILCSLNVAPNTNNVCNPRKIRFFDVKSSTTGPGLGADYIYRDPWGNPYIITLDLNYDDSCLDGFYYPLTKKSNAVIVASDVMIWSYGPDGKVSSDKALGAKGGENKDNVLSWQ